MTMNQLGPMNQLTWKKRIRSLWDTIPFKVCANCGEGGVYQDRDGDGTWCYTCGARNVGVCAKRQYRAN